MKNYVKLSHASRKQSAFLNLDRSKANKNTEKDQLWIAVSLRIRVLSITVKQSYSWPVIAYNFACLSPFGDFVSSDNKSDNFQIDTWYYTSCLSFCFSTFVLETRRQFLWIQEYSIWLWTNMTATNFSTFSLKILRLTYLNFQWILKTPNVKCFLCIPRANNYI